MLPGLAIATVVSQDPDNYGLNVTLHGFSGGQMPALPVTVGTHGPRDAVRGKFPALPLPGQSGLVAFPRGDVRNGVWLCSVSPALTDASTLTAGGTGSIDYEAKYSGAFFWHGQDGTTAAEMPDGSTMLWGTVMPAPTRHVLDANQARQAAPFPLSQRVRAAPGTFPFRWAQAGTGAVVAVSAAGAVTVTAAPGQSITLQVGSTSVVVQGGTVTVSNGGAAQAVKLADGSDSTVLMAQ